MSAFLMQPQENKFPFCRMVHATCGSATRSQPSSNRSTRQREQHENTFFQVYLQETSRTWQAPQRHRVRHAHPLALLLSHIIRVVLAQQEPEYVTRNDQMVESIHIIQNHRLAYLHWHRRNINAYSVTGSIHAHTTTKLLKVVGS